MEKIMFNNFYGLTDAVIEGRKTMTRRIAYDGEIKDIHTGYMTEGVDAGRLSLCDGNMIVAKSKYKLGEVVAVAQNYHDVYEELKRTHGSSSRVTREFFTKYVQGGKKPVSNKMYVRPGLMPHQIRITNIKGERLQDISDEDCLKEGVDSFLDIISQKGTEKYEKKADAIHWIEGGDDTHGWADEGINYCEKCAEKEAKKMNKGLEEELYRAVYSYAGGNEEDSSAFCEECCKPLLYVCLFTYLDEDLENMCLDSMCDLYLLEQILDSDHRDYAIEKLARPAFAALINRPGVGRKGLWESNPWVFAYSFELVK